MREVILVENELQFLSDLPQNKLKQYLLFFDKIGVPFLNSLLSTFKVNSERNWNQELYWLMDKGLVFGIDEIEDPVFLKNDSSYQDLQKLIKRMPQNRVNVRNLLKDKKVRKPGEIKLIEKAFRDLGSLNHFVDRLAALKLVNKNSSIEAYPILLPTVFEYSFQDSQKVQALHVVLNSLPIPDDGVAWEQIEDFKSDPDSKSKFIALKNWINDLGKQEMAQSEIEDKMAFLINDYEKHLQIHKMKYSRGLLETIVVTPAELLENVIKIHWSEVAKRFFS